MIKIAKFNSIRKIVQINTLVFISVFLVIAAFSGTYLYRLQREDVYDRISRVSDDVRKNLEFEFQFLNRNLQGLRNQFDIFNIVPANLAEPFYDRVLETALVSRRMQFTSYFALDRELAQKYFRRNGYVVVLRRDSKLFQDDKYFSNDNILRDVYTDPAYQADPREEWYQVAKRSRNIEFTNVYFDNTYYRQWFVTASLGLYDPKGRFQGMVGIDILLDEIVRQLEILTLGKTGGVLLYDRRSDRFLTRLSGKPGAFIQVNERYEHPDMDSKRLELWRHLVLEDHRKALFEGDSGNQYIVSTRRLENLPWTIIGFQERREAFLPLFWQIGLMLLTGFVGFILLVWVSTRFSRSINRPIQDLTKSLLENIRSSHKNQIMKVEVQTVGYREIQRVSRLVNKLVRVTNQKTKSYQQVVEEQRAKALHSARMASVGQMAGNVAHEINSPLAAIGLHAEILSKEVARNYPADKSLLNRIASISKITDRIAKIVKGFLAISREGKSDPLRVFWLQEILQETLDLCQSRMKANGVYIEVDPIPHLTIKCRGVQISQALLNLLNNSYDAIQTLDEKWIRVEFQTRADRVVISVTDSGTGIETEVAGKIMEPFFTTKDFNKGTGLGLSISRSILEDHGGRLYYDPQSDHTRFLMEIPIHKGHTEQTLPAHT